VGGVGKRAIERWAPGVRERERMLRAIGVSDAMELYRDVPRNLLLSEAPRIGFGSPLSEWELRRLWEDLMGRVRMYIDPPPFMGGGWCPHFVPALVWAVIGRSEFYSAYTPYQPEINQGLLQALFEYQSLIADLVELDVVNASMYDGSTAAAEALMMAMRVTRRRKIVVVGSVHPEYMEVIRTWLSGRGARIVEVPPRGDTGLADVEQAEKTVDGETAAVYMENPGFNGALDPEPETLAEVAHRRGALFVVRFEPLSLGIVKPPGRYGADIAVAEGQPLGLGMNYGGPGLGVFAVRWDRRLVRQMPGRLIGLTRDAEGRRAFTMILQTREQHIRREKATSNITTNEALMAIAAAVYLSLLGGAGLRELARSIWLRSHYLAKRLAGLDGVSAPVFNAEFFKEFTVEFPTDYLKVHSELKRRGLLGGLPLERFGMGERRALFCATELHSRRDIDRLVDAIADALGAAR